jgi:hypothetical protein
MHMRARWTSSPRRIEGNLEGPVRGEEGWQNQEVLDAAYGSLKSGKAETAPLVEKKH